MRIDRARSSQVLMVVTVAISCLVGMSFGEKKDPAATAPTEAEAQKVYLPEWDVIVDGKAESNGVLTLTFEPQAGESRLIRVNVVAKAKAKQIAKDLANQFTFSIGTAYKVKVDDNKVTVALKDKKKTPPFHIGIKSQELTGVSVRLKRG